MDLGTVPQMRSPDAKVCPVQCLILGRCTRPSQHHLLSVALTLAFLDEPRNLNRALRLEEGPKNSSSGRLVERPQLLAVRSPLGGDPNGLGS